MKTHEYFCCAIPLLNVGIYTILVEQFIVGLTAGILCIATSSLIGTSNTSALSWVVAVFCIAVAAAQPLGFIGVKKENTTLFKRYVTINSALVAGAFGASLVYIVISLTKQKTAEAACVKRFFATPNSTSETICKIFTFVNIGTMGGLWIILLIAQCYFLVITGFYSSSQQADHAKYLSIYSTNGLEDNILLGDRADPNNAWDARPSTDSFSGARAGRTRGEYQHARQDSTGSMLREKNSPTKETAYNGANYQDPYSRDPFASSTRQFTDSTGYDDMHGTSNVNRGYSQKSKLTRGYTNRSRMTENQTYSPDEYAPPPPPGAGFTDPYAESSAPSYRTDHQHRQDSAGDFDSSFFQRR